MHNLANCYMDGIGIEKNFENAVCWDRKEFRKSFSLVAENDKANFENKVELCNECKKLYIDYQWCQQCNSRRFQKDFSKWTSKNEFIDNFIQEAQLNAKNSYEVLEWIPFDKLSNINYHDKGGFSEIHKAIWLDGPIYSWDFDKQRWNRWKFQMGYEIILKILNNSSNLSSKFLDEWKYHYNCQKYSFSKFIQFFGITQDPHNLNYIILVISYAKKGRLKVIHESKLTHGDFHDDSDKNEIYGVLPFMAPELLRVKPYILASDIYSFSMIMCEFTSGIPPFNYKAHDFHLGLSICEGERPEIIRNTPKCYVDLMKKCWDSDPENRPTLNIRYLDGLDLLMNIIN
ncbi:hypothetical protein RclHR1_00430035 [Rhizophagus clarus]|nr:hypothetical protein RclHR1_00430035 [Rhizophagus clarus]